MMPIRENPENGLGSPQMVSINDPLVALANEEAQPTPQKGGRQYSTNSSGTQIRESGRDDTVVFDEQITLEDLPGREHLPYYDVYNWASFNPHYILVWTNAGRTHGYFYFGLVSRSLFEDCKAMQLVDVMRAEDKHVNSTYTIRIIFDEDKGKMTLPCGGVANVTVSVEADGSNRLDMRR